MWRGCLADVIFGSLYLEGTRVSVPYVRDWRRFWDFLDPVWFWVSSLNVASCFRFLCVCDQVWLLRCLVFRLILLGNVLIKLCFVHAFVCLTCRLFCMTLQRWRRHFGRSWSWCDVFLEACVMSLVLQGGREVSSLYLCPLCGRKTQSFLMSG